MSEITFKLNQYSASATSTSGQAVEVEDGDLVIRVYGMEGTAGFAAPTSYTELTQCAGVTGNGPTRVAINVFYRYITSTGTEAAASAPHTSSTSATYRWCQTFIVKNAPTSNAFDTAAANVQDNFTSPYRVCPSVAETTTVDNVLCIHILATDVWTNQLLEPGPMLIDSTMIGNNVQAGAAAAWTFQETAGAIETFEWYNLRAVNDSLTAVIPVKLNSGINPARGDVASSPAEIIYAANDTGNGAFPSTSASPAGTITDIDGLSTSAAALSNNLGSGINQFFYLENLGANTTDEVELAEFTFDLGAYTGFASNKWCFQVVAGSGLDNSRLATVADHGVVGGFKSGTNEYALWDLAGNDTRSQELKSVVIDGSTTIMDETNTFDASDITGVVFGARFAGAAGSANVALEGVYALDTITLRGGYEAKPCSWSTARDVADSAFVKTIDQLGDGYLTKHDIQVGVAGEAIYFHTNGEVLFTPDAADIANGDPGYQADAAVSVTVLGDTSGQVFKFKDPMPAGSKTGTFTMSASCTSDPTWDFDGGSLTNWNVTLREIGTNAYTGFRVINSPEVTHNDAHLGGMTFDGCTDTQYITITGATQAALQTALDRLPNCTFSNSTTYGLTISFTGTGDVSLNAPSGLTVDKTHYTSTNASGLTMVIGSSGASFGTTSTGGSATGFTVSNDKTYTIVVQDSGGNALTGCEVTLLERGTTTEVDHDDNTAGTYSYTFTYSSDVDLDVSVFKEGYVEYWDSTAQLLNQDQSITVTLQSVPASQN